MKIFSQCNLVTCLPLSLSHDNPHIFNALADHNNKPIPLCISTLSSFINNHIIQPFFFFIHVTRTFTYIHSFPPSDTTSPKSIGLSFYYLHIFSEMHGDHPSLHARSHLTFTAPTVQRSAYDVLDSPPVVQQNGSCRTRTCDHPGMSRAL